MKKAVVVKNEHKCSLCSRPRLVVTDSDNPDILVLWCIYCDGWPFDLER